MLNELSVTLAKSIGWLKLTLIGRLMRQTAPSTTFTAVTVRVLESDELPPLQPAISREAARATEEERNLLGPLRMERFMWGTVRQRRKAKPSEVSSGTRDVLGLATKVTRAWK